MPDGGVLGIHWDHEARAVQVSIKTAEPAGLYQIFYLEPGGAAVSSWQYGARALAADPSGITAWTDLMASSEAQAQASTPTYRIYATARFTDLDGDGLSDAEEALLVHTDPARADTDGDGVADGAEWASGTDPLLPDASADPDSDFDGLPDAVEVRFGLQVNAPPGLLLSFSAPVSADAGALHWNPGARQVTAGPASSPPAWGLDPVAGNYLSFDPAIARQQLRFDGSESWSLAGSDQLTVLARLRLTSSELLNRWIVGREADEAAQFDLFATWWGNLRFRIPTTAGTLVVYSHSDITPTVGRWLDLAAVFDQTRLTLWLNGQIVDRADASQPCTLLRQSTAPVLLGAPGTPYFDPFRGSIQKLEIYQAALDPAEIQARFEEFADPDGDLLITRREVQLGLHPRSADTDLDGLGDGEELQIGTDPNQPDSDGDTAADGWEARHGFDPLSPQDGALDSDGDGVLNRDEFLRGTDPRDPDSDDDGLDDGREVQLGTDPLRPDTDDDRMPDGWEVAFSTDPLLPDARADPDGDGLDNGAEQGAGTDPLRADTDGDGLDDGREIAELGTSPVSADTDRDGLLDPYELRYGLAAAWPSGLVGAWPFEALAASGQVADSGPRALHGTAVVPPLVVAGRWDNGFSFAQGTERVSVAMPLATLDAMRGRFAFSLWLRIPGHENTNRSVLNLGQFPVSSPWLLRTEFAGLLALLLQGKDASGQSVILRAALPGGLPVGEWVWIGGGCDGQQLWLASDRNEATVPVPAGFQPLGLPADPVLFIGATPSLPDLGCRAALDQLFLFCEPQPRPLLRALHQAVLDLDGDGLWTREEAALDPALDPTRADTDGDGLDDGREIQLGSDPLRADTDADGMPDGWEVARQFDPTAPEDALLDADQDQLINRDEFLRETDPRDPDSDDDGLDDGREVQLGTDPLRPDTDGDGMPDSWEVRFSTDPLLPDARADPDGDGLDNGAEQAAGTDPLRADTDGDGLDDGREIAELGTSPVSADTDRDGLLDPYELRYGLAAAWPSGLVGAWPFEALGAGGQVADSGPRALHGTAVVPPLVVAGRWDNGFSFAQGTERLSVAMPLATLDAMRGRFAFSLWLRIPGHENTNRSVLNLGRFPVSSPWLLRTEFAGLLALLLQGKDASGQSVILRAALPGGLPVGEWVWIGGGCDGQQLWLASDRNEATVPVPAGFQPLGLPADQVLFIGATLSLPDLGCRAALDQLFLFCEPQPRSLLRALHQAVLDLDGDGLWTREEAALDPALDPTRADTDGDGLDDGREIQLGSDPLRADTDADGMPDGWEVARQFDPTAPEDALLDADQDQLINRDEFLRETDPRDSDSDDDGLDDGREVQLGTDPLRPDTDGDGMPDGWEVRFSTDPLLPDARADPDGDGLDNGAEQGAGTDPLRTDTDGDGLDDGREIAELGTSPVSADTDRDGLLDPYELRYGLAAAWPSGLVGAWPFEALGAGGQVADSGPRALHGTAVVPPLVVAGRWDNGFSFAQGTERLSVAMPLATLDAMRGRFAFSLWLRIPGHESTNRSVLNLGRFPVSSPWLLRTEFAGLLALLLQGKDASGQSVILRAALPGGLPVGEWVWIGGGCDGQQLWLASDRNEATVPVPAGFQPLGLPTDQVLFIGATPSLPDLGCRAALDQLFLFCEPQPRSLLRALHQAVLDLDGDGLWTREEAALDHALDPTRADTDGDGLDDGREIQLGSDPLRADTDADGMPDGWELARQFDPTAPEDALLDADQDQLINRDEFLRETDPRDPDSDDDGLDDGREVQLGTDPLRPDTDGDGMPDGWEVGAGLDPLDPNDASEDPDQDLLISRDEYAHGTDPHRADSDGDGLSDNDEVLAHNTDPTRSDTDHDSMPDAWEVAHGLNPALPPGLAGWWDFDEPDALGRFGDLAGLNGPAYPVGAPSTVAGWTGQAVGFDGSGAHFRVDDTRGLDRLHSEFTLSLWCRLAENAPINRVILARGEPETAPYSILAQYYRSLGATARIGGTRYAVSLPGEAGPPGVGQWAWLVVTRSGSMLRLYVDRALVASGASLPEGDLDPPVTRELLLGGGFLFSTPFLGAIDEVRFFDRCYEADELPRIHDAHLDPDGDGLSNAREYETGCDPHDADTDGDGLTDGVEVDVSRTRPGDPDTDDDGLPDGWEFDHGLDPLQPDAGDDPDKDGLSNEAEYAHGTHPHLRDTDSDQLTDAAEVREHQTDPTREDTDADGLPDPWELARPDRMDARWNPLADPSLLSHCTFNRVEPGHAYRDRITGQTMVTGDPAVPPRSRPGRLGQASLAAAPWPRLAILPREMGARLALEGWTIGIWIHADETLPAEEMPIITMRAAATPLRLELFTDASGLPRARCGTESGSALTPAPAGTPAIGPGQWRHLALCFDGQALSLAIDGQLRPDTTVAFSPPAPFPDEGWLGGAPDGTAWPGRFDDLRFYQNALTQTRLTEAFGGALPVLEWLGTGPGGGGFMHSARSAPARPGTIFAGSDVGGFFVTQDGGRLWRPVSAGLNNYWVQDILPDPHDPASAWVATGGGLYHYDGGARRHALTPDVAAEPIACLAAANPALDRPATLYAAVGDQRSLIVPPPAEVAGMVYRSSDGGATWAVAGRVPDATHVRALEVNPLCPSCLFAASDRGVYYSADGGASWAAANTGIARPDLACGLAVAWGATRDASTVWLATGLGKSDSGAVPSQVYCSTDGGATWAPVMNGLPASSPTGPNPNYRSIRASASNPTALLLCNIQNTGMSLYRSSDGGGSWTSVSATAQFAPGEQGFRGSLAVAWDVDLSDYPTLLAATWAMVLQSDDAGQTWRNLVSRTLAGTTPAYRTRGVDPTLIGAIAPDPEDPTRLFVGAVDIGMLQSDDAGLTFRSATIEQGVRARVEDVFAIVVDPEDPDFWYAAFGAGAAGDDGGVLRSADRGASWQLTAGSPPPAWVTSLMLRPGGGTAASRVLYAALYLGPPSSPTDTSHGWRIHRSADSGGAWSDISAALAQLPGTASVVELAPDPDDPAGGALVLVRDNLYDGSANALHRRTESGWAPVYSHPRAAATDAATVPGPFERITVDPDQPRRFLAGTFSRGLYESLDGGEHWQQIYAVPAYHLAVFDTLLRRGAQEQLILLVGNRLRTRQRIAASRGVVVLERSAQGPWQEATFSPLNAGLEMLDSLLLVPDPHRPGRIYLGTHGQGLSIGTY